MPEGALLLGPEGTIRFEPSPEMTAAFRYLGERMETNGKKWGVSLTMGTAALGAAAYVRGKHRVGYALFGVAGVMAAAAREAVKGGRHYQTVLATGVPRDRVQMTFARGSSRSNHPADLRIDFDGGRFAAWSLRLHAGEFDVDEASAFLGAFQAAKTRMAGVDGRDRE